MPDHETAAPWLLPYPDPTGKVNLGAGDFKELAERLTAILSEKILLVKTYAAAAPLKSGELAVQTKAGETFTLPPATTANQVIGVFCMAASCKVTTSGGASIIGDFFNNATATLTEHQHLRLQSDGTNWLITAGEPKREQTVESKASIGELIPQTISASRPALVTATVWQGSAGGAKFLVGPTSVLAASVGEVFEGATGGANGKSTITFLVPAGYVWKYAEATALKVDACWILL
jgi:hypothetical protein